MGLEATNRDPRHGRGDLVVPDVPGDLLDHIVFDGDVTSGPEGWYGNLQTGITLGHLKTERREQACYFVGGYAAPDGTGYVLRIDSDGNRLERSGIAIGKPACDPHIGIHCPGKFNEPSNAQDGVGRIE